MSGNCPGWSLATKVALGLSDPAGVKRVKPEQASKVTMRMPTLLPFGEGCMSREAIEARTRSIRRGRGHGHRAKPPLAWRKGGSANRGNRCVVRLAASTSSMAAATTGVDRVVGALKPGNAGGAKGPAVWHASEDGEVKVIGDEPANTDYDPDPSVEAHIARRR
jgi:hypothetical protein